MDEERNVSGLQLYFMWQDKRTGMLTRSVLVIALERKGSPLRLLTCLRERRASSSPLQTRPANAEVTAGVSNEACKSQLRNT